MEIPNRLLIGLAVIGILVAVLLWLFGLVPWWAIPIVAVAVPFALVGVLTLLFYAAWIASGSH